jgi:hypothetical protein
MTDRMNAAQLDAILRGLTPLLTTKEAPADPPTIPEVPTVAPQKRCTCCRKKLTLTDMDCAKCKTRFCSAHRLPELHACPHDFRKEGAAQLAAANPRVVADKLDRV